MLTLKVFQWPRKIHRELALEPLGRIYMLLRWRGLDRSAARLDPSSPALPLHHVPLTGRAPCRPHMHTDTTPASGPLKVSISHKEVKIQKSPLLSLRINIKNTETLVASHLDADLCLFVLGMPMSCHPEILPPLLLRGQGTHPDEFWTLRGWERPSRS